MRDYRRSINELTRADTIANLRALESLGEARSDMAAVDLLRTPAAAEVFAEMNTSMATVLDTDPYDDGEAQDQWWYALHQFYHLGLWLADRLLRVSRGRGTVPRGWRRPPRWVRLPGLACPGYAQTLVSVAELNFANLFRLDPFGTYLPTLLHMLSHNVFPRRRWNFNAMFETTLGWIRRGGFQRMAGVDGPAVTWSGVEHVRNPELFDTRTWRTRHNVILACAHRFGFLDIPLFYAALRGIRLGIWADNSF
ncbi:MAG: hypothetical protein GY842_04180, partial [bacterium]|nr:hypothetical protein [bacterium]